MYAILNNPTANTFFYSLCARKEISPISHWVGGVV